MARTKKTDKKNKRGNGEGTIYERSPGKWCAQIVVGVDPKTGKPKRKTVYGNKREEVRDKLLEIQNQLKNKTYSDPGNLTLGEWVDTWLNNYMKESLKLTTWDSYRSLADKHIIPEIGSIKLKTLETSDLQRLYMDKLKTGRADKVKNEEGKLVTKEGGLSPRTIRYINQVIRGALEQAIAEGKMTKNPCDAVKLPKNAKKEMKTLSKDDVRTFLRVAKDYRYFAAYYLELSTGIRRGELLGLKHPNLNLKEGCITIEEQLVRTSEGLQFSTPKTDWSKRTILLGPDVVKVLERHLAKQKAEKLEAGELYQDNKLVFATKLGTPIQPRSFTRDFQAVLKRAGLERIRFHDMRHTFATMLLEAGEQLNTVQELLGHHSPTFTAEVYGHVTKRMKKQAQAKITEILTGQAATQ